MQEISSVDVPTAVLLVFMPHTVHAGSAIRSQGSVRRENER